ncbi:MAG: cytochrome C [Alphaproteobacteria bacterium]|nr:cytochrome C [Alphaproteobacteria bacterium]
MGGGFGAYLRRSIALAGMGVVSLFFAVAPANALPSFARQTGQQCAACHNGFPELTPYGRLFKLNGYTFGGGQSNLPPLAMMIVEDYTHTQAGQSGGAKTHYGPNNNFSLNTGSIFYGGRILGDYGLGAFVQMTYNDPARSFHWDNSDVRWAHATTIYGNETVFGISVNNNPSVTDLWNTTPAWRYPFQSSSLSLTPSNKTIIEGTYSQQVLGLNGYVSWNRLVYAEVGGYHTLSQDTDMALGIAPNGTDSFRGMAPYWRLALQPQWGPNSFEIGTFGMDASINPGRVTQFGTNDKTDLGFDAQYQWLSDVHRASAQVSYITEHQNLKSSFAQGSSTNRNDQLHSFNAKATYSYEQTYFGTLAYSRIQGSGDPGLYSSTSANNSPNSDWWTVEADYIPFNHGGPDFWPWLNVKFGLQYIWYTKFNGATTNYNGAGRNAADNNTLYGFVWLTF